MEWYGEELRAYRRRGMSWWAVRAALYEARPELAGRVGDHVMRHWHGQREYVQKKPATCWIQRDALSPHAMVHEQPLIRWLSNFHDL